MTFVLHVCNGHTVNLHMMMMMMKTHVITVPPILKLTEMLVTFSEAVAILFPSELNDMAAMRLS